MALSAPWLASWFGASAAFRLNRQNPYELRLAQVRIGNALKPPRLAEHSVS